MPKYGVRVVAEGDDNTAALTLYFRSEDVAEEFGYSLTATIAGACSNVVSIKQIVIHDETTLSTGAYTFKDLDLNALEKLFTKANKIVVRMEDDDDERNNGVDSNLESEEDEGPGL